MSLQSKENKISLTRTGDQVLIKNDKGEWFAEGYYHLKEISELFVDRLGSFTAFGRIMEIDNFKSPIFKIDVKFVSKFFN